MNNESKLLVSFSDQSKSFTYGVEFGRLLEKIERGDKNITNNGFPIRIENVQLLKGISTSDAAVSNEFMKDLSALTSKMDLKKYMGEDSTY